MTESATQNSRAFVIVKLLITIHHNNKITHKGTKHDYKRKEPTTKWMISIHRDHHIRRRMGTKHQISLEFVGKDTALLLKEGDEKYIPNKRSSYCSSIKGNCMKVQKEKKSERLYEEIMDDRYRRCNGIG